MVQILEPKNLKEAMKRAQRNNGAIGMDGMEVEELDGYLARNMEEICHQIVTRNY